MVTVCPAGAGAAGTACGVWLVCVRALCGLCAVRSCDALVLCVLVLTQRVLVLCVLTLTLCARAAHARSTPSHTPLCRSMTKTLAQSLSKPTITITAAFAASCGRGGPGA